MEGVSSTIMTDNTSGICNIEIIIRSCNAVEHAQVKPKMAVQIVLKGILTLEQSTNRAFPSWTSFSFISLIALFSFITFVSFLTLVSLLSLRALLSSWALRLLNSVYLLLDCWLAVSAVALLAPSQ